MTTTPTAHPVANAQLLSELREWHADTLLLAERIEILSQRLDAIEQRQGARA